MPNTFTDEALAELLEAVFRQHEIAFTPPLRVSRIAGGQSNLTYQVQDDRGGNWVFRRPPPSDTLESAHDVLREYRIVSALQESAVPVAPTVAASNDPALVGASYAIYKFVEGSVLYTPDDASTIIPPERATIGVDAFDVLANLHLLEPDDVGLGDLGPREGYIERQLRRWSKQWEAQSPRHLPDWEAVRAQLTANPPKAQHVSIVHGDYRLGNMIVADGKIQAVLDWELCTLGDPLADVAYLANTWLRSGEQQLWESSPTRVGGFPELDGLLDHYATRTQLDLSELARYRAFSQWRMAGILEGVRMRKLLSGKDGPEVDAVLTLSVDTLAHDALALLEQK